MKTISKISNGARKNWKTCCGAFCGVGILFTLLGAGGNNSLALPGLELEGEIDPPSESEDAARKVFNGRFAKYGDSYYTVRVVCMENTGHLNSKMQQIMQGKEPGAVDHSKLPPHVTSMELIQLKGLKTVVSEDELSKADELNGVEWRGKYVVKADVERRRNLDLLSHVKKLDGKNDSTEIGWTEKPLKLVVSGKSWLQYVREQSAKPKQTEQEVLGLNFMNAMFGGGNVVEQMIDDLSASDWGQWWEPEGGSYQHCQITIRGDELEMDSGADIDQIMGGSYRVSTLNPEALDNFLGMMTAASGEEVVFLAKPNMEALEKAGLLEN